MLPPSECFKGRAQSLSEPELLLSLTEAARVQLEAEGCRFAPRKFCCILMAGDITEITEITETVPPKKVLPNPVYNLK